MAAIDTEHAARRLARVILSDIDLYIRERPKLGESREAQIEEGRRLFASRVTPALVPVFAMVLADRAAGRVNPPAAAPAPSIPASSAAATVGPVHSAPASNSAIEDEPATDPAIFIPPLEDQAPPALAARAVVDPARAPGASRSATEGRPKPAPPIAARSLADRRPAVPTPAARPLAPALPPPRAVARARPEIPVRVPPAPAATEAPATVATQARHVAPPAPQILAIVSVAAAIVVVFRLFFR